MNITTIIPVHEYSEGIEKLLNSAIDSVAKQDGVGDDRPEVLVVYAAALDNDKAFTKNKAQSYENLTLTCIDFDPF